MPKWYQMKRNRRHCIHTLPPPTHTLKQINWRLSREVNEAERQWVASFVGRYPLGKLCSFRGDSLSSSCQATLSLLPSLGSNLSPFLFPPLGYRQTYSLSARYCFFLSWRGYSSYRLGQKPQEL